ncbi:MAG TPA: ATP-binding protein [Herpetosiphonaceae bacterium]|nr:ATP-binding protein [Herpetosiphonaceae bacterium]
MRRLSLSTLLIGVNVGLLLLAVAGIATVAVRLLQELADQQALARVQQAGIIARQQIDSTGSVVATSAQLLSERPTLRHLLEQNDRTALLAFLSQFQHTSGLDATAVLGNEEVLSQSGVALPWREIASARRPGESHFLYRPAAGGPLLLGAWATTPLPDRVVGTALRLDDAFARRIGDEISLPIRIVEPEASDANISSALQELRTRASTTNSVVSARLNGEGSYVAVVPLARPGGDVVGLIETSMPTSTVAQSLGVLVRTLLLLALGVTVVAALISFLLGRRLARPLGTLTRAARRIGRGDLATPVPVAASTEIGTLASTLEEMRWQLLKLTDDLRRQQAEAEAIVTGIVEGVFSVDRERRIRYLNPQAAAMLGATAEAAIGRFCGDVLHPSLPGGVRPCAEQCPIVHARFRGRARATEHLVLPSGERRTVVIASAAPVDELQVQVMHDETEVEASRRARDSILANISHEFRTPLSAQLASIELLLDQLPQLSAEQIEQLVLSQQRGTLRLTQLIDNLLESARIEAGQATIRRQRVALDEVVEEAIELTRPLHDQRRQTVMVDLPYPLPAICGDTRRLTQVFVNLLGNAHKFAPEGSTIQIGGAVDAAAVMLWVEDQGPGLPTMPDQQLFSRWVRSLQDEPEQGGAGLGLWLVKSIVERHGGHVEASSTAQGTRMSIVLPIESLCENTDRRR